MGSDGERVEHSVIYSILHQIVGRIATVILKHELSFVIDSKGLAFTGHQCRGDFITIVGMCHGDGAG